MQFHLHIMTIGTWRTARQCGIVRQPQLAQPTDTAQEADRVAPLLKLSAAGLSQRQMRERRQRECVRDHRHLHLARSDMSCSRRWILPLTCWRMSAKIWLPQPAEARSPSRSSKSVHSIITIVPSDGCSRPRRRLLSRSAKRPPIMLTSSPGNRSLACALTKVPRCRGVHPHTR